MSEKTRKILVEKLPIAVVAVVVSFIIFNAIAAPAFLELMQYGNIAGAS